MSLITKIKEKDTCYLCHGVGEVMLSCCTGDLVDEDYALCPVCKEHLCLDKCPECNENT